MGLEIINKLKKDKGLTNSQIAEMSGVTLSTLDKITSGVNTNPKLDTLQAIANVLGCSLTDFGDNPKPKYVVDSLPLSEKEDQLIKKYRALDKHGKEKVDAVIEWETERLKEIQRIKDSFGTETAAEIIRLPIPLSLQAVSAGRGAYLGPEEFETVFVEENSLTKLASFAIRVSGDSMEPTYSDGDVLLIQGAEDIQIGEIGVFTMDGDGYVKKRGNGELISLNPEYAPIPMNESIWCNGRVIGILQPEWITEK